MTRLTFLLLLFVAAQPALIGKQPNRVANKTRNTTTNANASAHANSKRGVRPRSSVTYQSGLSLPFAPPSAINRREHYDPRASGNPLVITSGKYRRMKVSKNFTVDEYAHSGKKEFEISRIDPELVACNQRIRDFVGKPVMIDSGYRTFTYNLEVYKRMRKKPTRSPHSSGWATDIKVKNMSGQRIAEIALDVCGPDIGIGIGVNYAHIDVRGYFAIWKYDGVSNSQVAEVKQYRQASMFARNRARRGSGARRIKS
jgi:uncharacterized protein YcbK (DUF882 family)